MKKSYLSLICLVLGCCVFLVSVSCQTTSRVENSSNSSQQREEVKPALDMTPSAPASNEPSLVSLASGAFVVKRPSEWSDDSSAFNLIDENPKRIWATARGTTTPQTIVIALAEKSLLKVVAFDNLALESQFPGCGAKDVMVEMSDLNENDGFQKIAEGSLQEGADNQRFPVSAEVAGRWVRLTVKNNHGSKDVIELPDFRAYGTQLTQTPGPDVSGTYEVHFTGNLHLKQQGTSITGCYESRQGRVEGGIEGKAFKFTWLEKYGYSVKPLGTAVMVFSPDGKQFFSLWNEMSRQRLVLGKKISDDVGTCPNWVGSVEQQLIKDLEEGGRARIYGINFDSDSDRIKDESKPTLDNIVSVLKAKPDWKFTIEGHTDSTSTDQHNQELSERRAASVKSYLQSAGIDASRLKTVGFGATQPVTTNDDPLGRAQNRRVELIKQ